MTVKYILRELPGVAEVETILIECQSHPNPLWAPRRDDAYALAERISARFFGFTMKDTILEVPYGTKPMEAREMKAAWEADYEDWLAGDNRQDAELIADWEDDGWDVTDGAGSTLLALEFFGRPIRAALLGYGGRMPDEARPDDDIASETAGWGEKLASDAAKFKRGK